MKRRCERLAHAASELGCFLVPATGSRCQLLLDGLHMTVELHRDITMTSLVKSVKHQVDVAHRRIDRGAKPVVATAAAKAAAFRSRITMSAGAS
jgi:hypothetical protein